MISLMSFGKSVNENSYATSKERNNTFHNKTKSKTAVIERHRVWLNLTNADGLFKQILVGYIAGATNGIDNGYDGISMNANPYLDFYSVNGDKNLVIQGRGLPFVVTDEVPLGYRTTIESTFTITIDEVDGDLTDQDIYIEDKDNNVVHNLKDSPYSFTTVPGTFKDRFVLRYINNPIAAEDLVADAVTPEPTSNDSIVVIPITDPIVVIDSVNTEPIINDSIATPQVEEPIVVIDSLATEPIIPDPIVNDSIVAPPVEEPIVVIDTINTEPIVPDPIINDSIPAPQVEETIIVIDTEPIVIAQTEVTEPTASEPIASSEAESVAANEPIIIEATVQVEQVAEDPITNPVVAAFSEPIVFDSIESASTFDVDASLEIKKKAVVVSTLENQIKVNSLHENIGSVQVYDLAGRQLYQMASLNSSEFIISNIDSRSSFLIVRTQLKDGSDFVNKIGF